MVSLSRWIRNLAAVCLFAIPAHAEVQSFSDFTGGLNTYQSSVLLKDNESPSLQNVLLDETGAVTRRKGYSKLNSAAIGDGDDDVNGVYKLEQSDGDRYCVAFSSTSAYWSSDGCQTFTVFISTLTRNNDVNCDAYGDNLYCVSNGYNFRFDGTNDSPVGGMPASMKYIRVHRNRCFVAGGTSPSRLYWSNLGDCNTYTTGTDYVDIDAEDGDVIVGMGEPLFNFLPIYKKYSSWLLQFDNANTANRKMINISKTIGGVGHRTVSNFMNRQYFASLGQNGGQPGIYATDGINIEEASLKVRGSLSSVGNFNASTGRKNIDTKSDWDAGAFDTYALSSSRDSGHMQSSFTTVTDTLAVDFTSGTLVSIDTTTVPGNIQLSSTVFFDNWASSVFYGVLAWNCSSGSCEIVSAGSSTGGSGSNKYLRGLSSIGGDLANVAYTSSITFSSGSWKFTYHSNNLGAVTNCSNSRLDGSSCWEFRFQKDSSDNYYAARLLDNAATNNTTHNIQLIKNVGGTTTVFSNTTVTIAVSTDYDFEVQRSSDGRMFLLFAGAFISSTTADTSVGASVKTEMALSQNTANSVYNYFTNIRAAQYRNPGVFTSRIFDTYISTPTHGVLSSTFTQTQNVEGQVSFQTRVSTSPNNDLWDSYSAASDTIKIASAGKRYIQYQATLTTFVSTKTPTISAVSLNSGSTGTWTSPELFLANAVTTWGLFQTNQTTTGQGASIAYAIRTSTYAGGTAYAAKSVVTAGSSISASTGAYVVVIATFTIAVGTETAKTDVIVINWNEGTSARSATMAVFKNRLHYCAQSSSATYNDTCFVLDRNGAWSKWSGVNARHLNVVNQNFVMGGSTETSGGFVYKLYDTDSDDGSAISAFYETKDHPLGKIQNIKAVDRVYLIHKPEATTLSVGINADGGLRTQSYDVSLSTPSAFGVKKIQTTSPINGNSFRIKFSNNAASKPWEVHGYGISYEDKGLAP